LLDAGEVLPDVIWSWLNPALADVLGLICKFNIIASLIATLVVLLVGMHVSCLDRSRSSDCSCL